MSVIADLSPCLGVDGIHSATEGSVRPDPCRIS